MIGTPFLKYVVLLNILKTSLGGQIPPTSLIQILAIIFAIIPLQTEFKELGSVIVKVMPTASKSNAPSNAPTIPSIQEILNALQPTFQRINDQSGEAEKKFFHSLQKENHEAPETIAESMITTIPAYIFTQLKLGCSLGLLLSLPLIIIDIVVANLLTALGMSMVSPTTISFPLKILFVVTSDGWLNGAKSLLEISL
jgi:type III secretion protein R